MTPITIMGPNLASGVSLGYGMNIPVAGFTSAETFDSKRAFLLPRLPILVVLSLVTLLRLGVALADLGAGGTSWPLAFVLTATKAVVLTLVWKRRFENGWRMVKLELSPDGAALVGRHGRVLLPWDRIRYLGRADLIGARRPRFGSIPAVIPLTAIVAWLARQAGPAALVGVGTTSFAPDAPEQFRAALRHGTVWWGADAEAGRALTQIVVAFYDKNWRTGRIGDWIRAYRPDLLSGS